ncbi:MAG TPA: hypothetical protein DHW63_04225, partial [Hyphomonadaceae bacterium]|nr:hypothetical protein [Hyphomonadaceae bacterium]
MRVSTADQSTDLQRDALLAAGVAERDIQTSNLSVNPQYAYVENEQPRMTGYQANNTVSARVRN